MLATCGTNEVSLLRLKLHYHRAVTFKLLKSKIVLLPKILEGTSICRTDISDI